MASDYSKFTVEIQYNTDKQTFEWTNREGHPFSEYIVANNRSKVRVGPFTLDAEAYHSIDYSREIPSPIILGRPTEGHLHENGDLLLVDIDQWNSGLEQEHSAQRESADQFTKLMSRRDHGRPSKRYKGVTFIGASESKYE